jgi:methyl-accepting chemotaxis protein
MPYHEGETKSKDTLTGQRHLPPVNTYVYCLMPTGEPSSAIVLCSVFAYQDPNHADFKEDSEDAVFIEKRIDSGGWKFTHDIRTGTRKIQNSPKDGEDTLSLEIDQEDIGKSKIIFKFFDNYIEYDEEKQGWRQSIEGDVDLVVKGKMTATVTNDVKVTTDGNAAVEAKGDLSYKSSASGMLEIGNSVTSLGAMIGNLLQACIAFKSEGSPTTHTAPEFSATAMQIKEQWTQVFK